MHQTPQTRPGRAANEIGKGKADGNTATTPVEGEGMVGEDLGYNPTPEDLHFWEVYGDWLHANTGTHLDRDFHDDSAWQAWWRDLAVMPSRRYGTSSGRIGRRFVRTLGVEFKGVLDRQWNSERFIVFQTVILQRDQRVTVSHAI